MKIEEGAAAWQQALFLLEQTLQEAEEPPEQQKVHICGISNLHSSHEMAALPHAPGEKTGMERVTLSMVSWL